MKNQTNNLSSKAMLVSLRVSMWTGRTKDRGVSSEVLSAKNADADAGAWWTYQVPRKSIVKISNAAITARIKHANLTLPWMDGGQRILPSAMFMTYAEEMRKVKENFETAVEDFLTEYPTIVAQTAQRLGKLHAKQLPSISELRERFGMGTDVLPIPNADDFRVDLGNDEVESLRANVKKNIEDKMKSAQQELWSRMDELIVKIHDTLKQPKKIFRDSLIKNLSEFCELVPKLNVTDDVNLEVMRKEAIEKLAILKPSELREDKAGRKKAVKDAKELRSKMSAYFNC